MTRKRGKSRKSSAIKRARRFKGKYVVDSLTKRPKKLLPAWYLYLRPELIEYDFLETRLFPKFVECGVPTEGYDFYMAWAKQRAQICLTFSETTRAEEYAVLRQTFITRGLDATKLDCLAPTIDAWNNVMLGKKWLWGFETGTAEGWKMSLETCCLLVCQDPDPDALPMIQSGLGHESNHCVNFDVKYTGLVHIKGSAYLFDLRGWQDVTTDILLDYWFMSGWAGEHSQVDFYNYDTGALLKHYDDSAPTANLWYHYIHTDLATLLGKRVCLLFSKGYGRGGRYWDDILFKIKGIREL